MYDSTSSSTFIGSASCWFLFRICGCSGLPLNINPELKFSGRFCNFHFTEITRARQLQCDQDRFESWASVATTYVNASLPSKTGTPEQSSRVGSNSTGQSRWRRSNSSFKTSKPSLLFSSPPNHQTFWTALVSASDHYSINTLISEYHSLFHSSCS
jgi:hypothetical protein